jgi:hypothetical protein
VKGSFGMRRQIPARGELVLDRRASSLGDRARFKGGRRACVIVMGDHRPIVPIVVEVRDEQGKIVARDEPAKSAAKADALGNDVAAAIWYPPRDAYYTISIKNLGAEFNDVWIAIK